MKSYAILYYMFVVRFDIPTNRIYPDTNIIHVNLDVCGNLFRIGGHIWERNVPVDLGRKDLSCCTIVIHNFSEQVCRILATGTYLNDDGFICGVLEYIRLFAFCRWRQLWKLLVTIDLIINGNKRDNIILYNWEQACAYFHSYVVFDNFLNKYVS